MPRVYLALDLRTGLLAIFDADRPNGTPLFHIAVLTLAMPMLTACDYQVLPCSRDGPSDGRRRTVGAVQGMFDTSDSTSYTALL